MHCDIEFNQSTGLAVVRDLQSRNGTFVNSERIQNSEVRGQAIICTRPLPHRTHSTLFECKSQVALMHGDFIRAGYDPENFKFEYSNPPAQGAPVDECVCAMISFQFTHVLDRLAASQLYRHRAFPTRPRCRQGVHRGSK